VASQFPYQLIGLSLSVICNGRPMEMNALYILA
jgi:hypothetical protein